MEAYIQYCIAVGVTVVGILLVKGVSLIFRCIEFKANPDALKKERNLPEGVFRQLKNKQVVVKLKTGETLLGCKYIKTIFFADGDFAINTNVFFQFQKDGGNLIFVGGRDVLSIETVEKG